MERISAFGRIFAVLVAALLLNSCATSGMPKFSDSVPFLEGEDYVLMIEQGVKEEVIERYTPFFGMTENTQEHPEGAACSFTYNGIPFHFTIVPNDITPDGGWAVFIVRLH